MPDLTQITGGVVLPDGSVPYEGRVHFTPVGWDCPAAGKVQPPATRSFTLGPSGGLVDVYLSPSTTSLREMPYRVSVTHFNAATRAMETTDLGLISVPEVAEGDSVSIRSLLSDPGVIPTAPDALAQVIAKAIEVDADRAAAQTARTAAETAAAEAALYDGPKVDTFGQLASVTPAMLAVGGLIRVIEAGAVYQRVSTGGDLNYTGSGGVRLNVMPINGALNVTHFGVVGTGGNDTAVFQAAVNTAATRKVMVVDVPAGDFIVNGLALPSGVWLRGAGYHNQTGGSVRQGTRIARSSNTPIMTMTGTSFVSGGPMHSHGRVTGISFNGANFSADMVQMDAASLAYFEDCVFSGTTGRLIRMREVFDSRFVNCRFGLGGSADGAVAAVDMISGDGFEATNQIHFTSCVWESFAGTAIRGRRVATAYNTNEIYFTMCKVESEQSSQVLVDFQDCVGVHFNLMQLAGRGEAGQTPAAMMRLQNCNAISGDVHAEVFGSTHADWQSFIRVLTSRNINMRLSLYGYVMPLMASAVDHDGANANSCSIEVLDRVIVSQGTNIPTIITRDGTAVIEGDPPVIWFRDPAIAGQNWFFGNLVADGASSKISMIHNSTEIYRVQGDDLMVINTGLRVDKEFRPPVYTLATLPSAYLNGAIIYVTDATAGACHARSDGTNWRRMDNGALIAAPSTSYLLSAVGDASNSPKAVFTRSSISGESWTVGDMYADGAGSAWHIVHNSTEVLRVQNDNLVVAPTGLQAGYMFRLPVYTVATLPSWRPAGGQIFVSNASGGACVAYADGTNWRRMDTNAVVT